MAEILVAEDDPAIREALRLLFVGEGYGVRLAADGAAALIAWQKRRPDVLILDVMMPRKSGLDVLRDVRKADALLPVILLTAKGEDVDKVLGLGLGADDYVTKPFSAAELVARVAALLRRTKPPPMEDRDTFAFGSSRVDVRRLKLVNADGREFDLAPREVHLLRLLATHPGEALARNFLLNAVWGVTYYGTTRTLDQHMCGLRRKLGDAGSCIETVMRVGYRFTPS